MTLLRDLITIPEAVHSGDFVMNLAEGVSDSEATLRHYVVTTQLERAYDNALGFIASALKERTSKAAYLDGSFGSGKSHFMAVLHLLLQRDPRAREIPELASAIAKHDAALTGRSFELVPLHMIGAESMEAGVFGGYIEHLGRTDPQAPPPGVYADEPLFEEAESRRRDLGDQAFFERLNGAGASGADEGWGELAAAWTPETYEQARTAPAGDPDRGRLGGAIVAGLMPGFREAMRGVSTGYVDMDTGLAELARHARDRGNDALVLFLDELILWLGSRIQDPAFVAREGQKLIKLIEFTAPRPIPIVSFVARQRDLREFVGDQIPGAERLSFADALKHWEDRFHHVTLHDRDLPKIAERRLLEPRSEAARQEIDAAFRETERARPEVLNVLMTEEGDRELFRSTYPFSPAFMSTLVAASSALQRERTALRVMLQLLVDRRDQLEVGDLVSVGDLFDVLSQGDEPFTEEMKRQFEHAKVLYRDQFRPLLLAENGGSQSEATASNEAIATDDRLVKTLLLAALLPQTGPLRNLDAAKLTALNHGSIAAPIPGQEKAIVLGKLRKWAAQVGALRLGDDLQNPSVELRLTGIDVESIVSRAASVDNAGERRRLVKKVVLDELGVEADTALFTEHQTIWRGTRRTVEVVFGNARDTQDLPDDALRASGDRWKVVVDYPFDPGHSPLDDLDRLERWRADHGSTRTVCWIPAFFSQALQRDLARLVIVSHVLEGERLEQYADHLSPQDRPQARGILGDLRSALEQRLRTAIRQAYGVERAAPDTIDASHGIEERLQSLSPGFAPQVPVGAQLADALDGLIGQMLDAQYPNHPRFEAEPRLPALRLVLAETQRAIEMPDGRIEVPSDRRRVMRQIATPLRLGVQYEAPFVLGTHWKDHLDRAAGRARQAGQEQITVRDLRAWIDEPHPLGLPREVGSLIALVYAAQTRRSFRLHGGPAQAQFEKLDDDLELVAANLPGEDAWRSAVSRASSILGTAAVNPARNPSSVEKLADDLRAKGGALLGAAGELVPLLEQRLRELGGDPAAADRVRTAAAAHELAQGLAQGDDPVAVIERLAAAQAPTTEQALGTSLASAAATVQALDTARWQVPLLVAQRARSGEQAHRRIVDELTRALSHDEFAEPLAPAVEGASAQGVALLGEPKPPKPPDPPGATRGSLSGAKLGEARSKLDELECEQGSVQIDLHWTISTNDPQG